MSAVLKIKNRDARALWLQSHLLSAAPVGPLDLMGIIRRLGFVQLDTIQVVSRAHHHILWSRNQNYREKMFDPLLSKDRLIFEHFTHDASILPMEFLPFWTRQFDRKRQEFKTRGWFKDMLDEDGRNAIKERIRKEGALSTHAFDTKRKDPKVVWSRPPHKMALDYLWYCGELATCYRENFKKFYNLPERVFPQHIASKTVVDEEQIDWLCTEALDRLGFATAKEIQGFWEAANLGEVQNWISQREDLVPVLLEGADGELRESVATFDIEDRLEQIERPTSRLRILNPFDPAIRDRNRLKRLFGMDYKIEIFVPAQKRQYGYYVYPLLEGDRFVGRVEINCDRKKGRFSLSNLWVEPKVAWTPARARKLEAELDRLARFVGCTHEISVEATGKS